MIKDARKLMELASERAGKYPKTVVTDKQNSYLDGIELAFGANTKHIASKPFTVENNTNLIERFHGTLKGRTKVMRGLKDIKSAKTITDGWLLHYNYLRPHESLNGKTPAQMARVNFPYRNWQDIVAGRRITTPKQTSVTSAIPIPTIPRLSYKVAKKAKKKRARLHAKVAIATSILARMR